VNFEARLSEKKVVKVLLNIQGTADGTKNQHLKQACQTGGPIAGLMWPAVTYLSHTIT
jgi:hypothetical protein